MLSLSFWEETFPHQSGGPKSTSCPSNPFATKPFSWKSMENALTPWLGEAESKIIQTEQDLQGHQVNPTLRVPPASRAPASYYLPITKLLSPLLLRTGAFIFWLPWATNLPVKRTQGVQGCVPLPTDASSSIHTMTHRVGTRELVVA